MSLAARPEGPSLRTLLGGLLQLRFRSRAGHGLLASASRALPLAAALGLGAAGYLLFAAVPALRQDPTWRAFALQLYCFLLGLFWLLWPLVAAQVDDSYELGRFLCFPISPGRLYAAQTLTAALEPSTLAFYPALVGATLGVMRGPLATPGALAPLELAALALAFIAMNIAAGRCLLGLAMNALSSRRSAELLLLVLLALLLLAALLPPVDVSWLLARLGGFGASARDLALLSRTAASLAWLPPGLFASGLLGAASGASATVWGAVAAMLALAAVLSWLGLRLLLHFHRARGESLWPRPRRASRERAPGGNGLPPEGRTAAVLHKELATLLANPKARLLFFVPFFLLIILKIVGAGPLFAHLLGPRWLVVVASATSLYALTMLAGQLFANAFGTDGEAVRWVYWTDTPLAAWLRARNLAQACFALAQVSGLWLLARGLFPHAPLPGLGAPALVLAAVLVLLLGLGDLLSILRPRRFHFSLARRDRADAASVLSCLLVAALAASPLACFLFLPVPPARALLAAALELGLALGLYAHLSARAARLLVARRERLVDAVARDSGPASAGRWRIGAS